MNSPMIRPDPSGSLRPSGPGVSPTQDPSFYLPKVEPGRFFRALLRRGWIAVLLMLVFALGTYALLSRMPKMYLSTGSVYVSTEAPRILEIEALAAEESRDLEQLQSVEQGLLSSTLLLKLIDRFELTTDPTFAEPGMSRQDVLGKLSERVGVGLRRGTRFIDIAVEDTDPERAAAIVEAIKTEYEALSGERQDELTGRLSAGLAREEERLHERMEASAAAVEEFREANQVPGLEGDSGDHDELAALRSELSRAKSERLRLEAEYEAFRKFDSEDPDAFAGLARSEHAAEVMALLRDLRAKELEFSRIKERYLFKHPVYKEIAADVESLQTNLAEAVRSAGEAIEKSYNVAKGNESKLAAELELARTRAVDIDGLRAEFATLTREAEADRELYAAVSKRLRETGLAASVPSSVLSWRERPLVPEDPHRPRKALFSALAGAGGFMFGLMAIVGLELGDRRVRDAATVTRATGVPLLARVPVARSNDSMQMISDPGSETAEAFRRLRAVLIPPTSESNLRTVLFTSARPDEGKSFCAMNHAVSLAMQGHRTLLLDADLRSPGLSGQHLRESGGHDGLGAYLEGDARASDACVSTPVPKLFLLSSGQVRSDAAELLAGSRFPALLEEAYRWFDRVVIDVPAVLSASDVQAVARFADRTCLVVGEGGSDRRDLRQAAELLRASGANLVGFVWNEHSPRDSSGAEISVKVTRHALTSESNSLNPNKPSTTREIDLSVEDRA